MTVDGAGWSPGDVLRGSGLFVLVFAASQVLAALIGAPFGVESKGFYGAVFIVGAFAEVGYALIARRYAGKYSERPWRALGIHRPRPSTLGWAFCGLTAALSLSAGYSLLIETLDINTLRVSCDEQIPAVVREDARLLALAAFVVLAFAPTCEELFFRGFAYRGLAGRWGVVLGIVGERRDVCCSSSHVPLVDSLLCRWCRVRRHELEEREPPQLDFAHTAFNAISIAALASGGWD